MQGNEKKWDLFISHASEDKDGLVRPLAQALAALGVEVCYDEFSLSIGDSLSRSIDKGIAQSRYGLVVISPAFIAKAWPEYELRGLIAREIDRPKVILPIWHGVNRDQVVAFSPSLADKVAIRTADASASDVAIQILGEVRPDLYAAHPRSELVKRANGTALRELQERMNELQDQLSEFQCPHCGAQMSTRVDAPLDPEEKHWDSVDSYDCGFQQFGGSILHPCPSDPKFPKLSEFEFRYEEHSSEPHWKWICHAIPLTDMARCLRLQSGYGSTKEEAAQKVTEAYNRHARQR